MRGITTVFLLVILAAHPAYAAVTTTTLTLSRPSIVIGETTIATATVTDISSAPTPPTGEVHWTDFGMSGTYDGTCTLSPLSATASSCSITYGPGGAFSSVTLQAFYFGDGPHTKSIDSAVITVNKRATATSVSPNTVQIASGNSVVLTATVGCVPTAPGAFRLTTGSKAKMVEDASTTSTVSELLKAPSFTVSSNVSVVCAVMAGATNEGVGVLAPVSVTDGPAVCVQEYVSGSPSGSELAVPSSATTIPGLAVWSGPASATGGCCGGDTVAVPELPSCVLSPT